MLIEKAAFHCDRMVGFQLLHCHTQRVTVSAESRRRLLTEKLATVDVSRLRDAEPQYFWHLLSRTFQLVGA